MKKQISIGFTERQLLWLRSRAEETGCPIAERVRRLVDTAIAETPPEVTSYASTHSAPTRQTPLSTKGVRKYPLPT